MPDIAWGMGHMADSSVVEDRPKSKRVGALRGLVPFLWPYRGMAALALMALILTAGPVLRVPLDGLRAHGAPAAPASPPRTLREAEREHVLAVLAETRWVLGGPNGAAARLGLNRSTLQFRLKKLGISRPGA